MGEPKKEPGKILKVTIEHENIIHIAEGEDAEQWLGWVNFCEYLTIAHGHPQSFKWTKVEEK